MRVSADEGLKQCAKRDTIIGGLPFAGLRHSLVCTLSHTLLQNLLDSKLFTCLVFVVWLIALSTILLLALRALDPRKVCIAKATVGADGALPVQTR